MLRWMRSIAQAATKPMSTITAFPPSTIPMPAPMPPKPRVTDHRGRA